MRIKDGFQLRDVAGRTVVLRCGNELNLNELITLNETGKFLWERMQGETSEEELAKALLAEYDVDEEKAMKSVKAFVGNLERHGFLA